MLFPTAQAYLTLIQFDLLLANEEFSALYDKVRNHAVASDNPTEATIEQVLKAVDLACTWYWKEALCLQRSAATTCLLRRHGIRDEMVLGVQDIPFKAHAWVEVSGRVVNDKPYMTEMYAVLDRC
jgi:Transglutaminase-like superfamily